MSSKKIDFSKQITEALDDIRVELLDEFDRNFERKAFFSKAWQRKRPGYRANKPLLIDTGNLRQSIRAHTTRNSVVFTANEPYAAIHNYGGTITVTRKMKGYFWHKYKEAIGGFGYTKKGAMRNDAKNRAISSEAQFYRAMALQKVGSKIKIPKRQFIGVAPEVEKAVREIVEQNLYQFVNNIDITFK